MYLGLREIRAAAGRFGLIVGVVALVAFMVITLSALTAGLRSQSVSAIEALPGSGLVVQQDSGGAPATLSDSAIEPSDAAQVNGTTLGIATLRAGHNSINATVAAFGRSDVKDVTLNPDVAETLGVKAGDSMKLGNEDIRIDSVSDVGQYAHQPVIQLPMSQWHTVSGRDSVNAVIVDSSVTVPAGLTEVDRAGSLNIIPGFKSEHSSLLLIQGLLLVISAVVVAGFFAVWTGQRIPSLAVVRAMGAGRWYLLRDGLAQATLVLLSGLILGAALGFTAASLLSGVAPIAVDLGSGFAMLAGMGVLGLIGAALALRPLTSVDPLVALNR